MAELAVERYPQPQKDLIMRYEELRARALGKGDRPEGGLGWALLVRKGMLEWLRAWQEHGPRRAPEHIHVGASRIITGSEQQNEIVRVWTGMVFGQLSGRMLCT